MRDGWTRDMPTHQLTRREGARGRGWNRRGAGTPPLPLRATSIGLIASATSLHPPGAPEVDASRQPARRPGVEQQRRYAGQRAVPDEAVGACSRSCRTSKTVPRGSAAAARRATVSDPDVALLSSPKLRRARQPPHLARPARAAIRHLRIHRSVLQPPAPTLDPQDALPGQLRTATTLSARRLRAMARTRQNQHQQQTPRCHANRDRSTPAPNRAARAIAFAESDRPGGREPEMPLP
jgi:hypothetical protein